MADAKLLSLLTQIVETLAAPRLPEAEGGTPAHMTLADFAQHMCVSERRLRALTKQMEVGVHFFRNGRRYVFRVEQASEFVRTYANKERGPTTFDGQVLDELARRRALQVKKWTRG